LFPTSSGGTFLYLGILPLMLGAVAFFSPTNRAQKFFWLGLAFFTFIFSFGSETFLHPIAYLTVPGFKLFRNHERTIFLTAFAAAMLCGYGAKAITEELRVPQLSAGIRRQYQTHAHWLRWLALSIGIFCLASFLAHMGATVEQRESLGELTDRAYLTLAIFIASWAALHFSFRQTPVTHLPVLILAAILVLDLFSSNWRNNAEMTRPDNLFPPQKASQHFKADESEAFRVYSEGLLPGHGNSGLVYEFEDTVGDSPLELQANSDFDKSVDEVKRWQLLNVKYILTRRKLDDGRLIPVTQEDGLYTYELAPHLRLPRAHIVHRAIIANSPEEQLKLTKEIEPKSEVVLAKSPGTSPSTLSGQSSDGSDVQIIARRPDRMELRTSSSVDGILVLSEVYYPGWKASVDGQQVEILRANSLLRGLILRANYLLRGSPIAAGFHDVIVWYEPLSLKQGLAVSAIAGALALATLMYASIRNIRSGIEGKLTE
jgi:hypothetical protein